MIIQPKRIIIDGLQVFPSNFYQAGITGVFNSSRETQVIDLMTDGSITGNSRLETKTMELQVGTVQPSIRFKLMLNHIFAKHKFKLQLEYEEIGFIETDVVVEAKIESEDNNTCMVILKAFDPYLYATNWKEINLSQTKTGGVHIGTQYKRFPIIFNTTITGNRGELDNEGLYPTWSVVEIKGACSDICVTNETTGEIMKIDIDLKENDVLVIDSRLDTRGIYLNGISDISLKNGNWLSVPQDLSTWKFTRTASANLTEKHCTIKFREVYI